MTTMTPKGLTPAVTKRVRRLASRQGKSMNRCIVDLIEQSIGGDLSGKPVEHTDLDHLFGSLSADDAQELEQAVSDSRAQSSSRPTLTF